MRNRILGAFLALCMSLGLAAVFTAAPAHAAKICVKHSDTDRLSWGAGRDGKPHVAVIVKTVWKACDNGDRTWSQPKRMGYRMEVMENACDGVKYVEVNSRFWDGAGRNFNPGAYRLYCTKDFQWDEKNVKFFKADRLYVVDGKSPRARTSVEVERSGENYHGGVSTWMDYVRTHPLD